MTKWTERERERERERKLKDRVSDAAAREGEKIS